MGCAAVPLDPDPEAIGAPPGSGGCSPSASSQPMRAPAGTVVPAGTTGWNSPPASASTSTSTLSVASRSRASPSETAVPVGTSHSSMVPSCMVRPIFGSRTSTATSSRPFEETAAPLRDAGAIGDVRLLQNRGERYGGEGSADAQDRRVQVVEGRVLDLGGDLPAEPAEGDGLVHHEDPVGAAYGGDHGLGVQGLDGAGVDHL